MRKTVVISLVFVVTLVLAGGVAWYLHARIDSEPESTSPGGLIRLDKDHSTAETTAPLSVSSNTNGTQAVALDHPANNTGEHNTPKTITPQDFKQFETYKNAQATLFMDMKVGSGNEAAVGKKISVNYRGWLTDGTEFDESYAKGKPFEFVLGEHRVIIGWEQGLVGMKVGGKRLLIIPPIVGYGSQAHDPIPANSVLVFEVEVLGVN